MIRAYFLMGFEDLSKALAIREKVFVEEQGFSRELERDGLDACALHAVVEDEGVPCATGRLYSENGQWHIGRMAVLKEKRGLHLGDLLVRMLLDRAIRSGAEEVYVGAQKHAQGFYEKLSFEVCGPEYDEEGCAHVPMMTTKERIEKKLFGGCGGECASCGKCKG